MPVVNTIQLRRDSLANWTSVNPTLAAGEVGYDSTSNKIKIGDGTTAWNSLEYASGGASILVSATEPDDPEVGDVWFNTESGITYVYYDSSWVSVAGSSGAPIISDTAPADPVLGTQWFNSSTGKSYLYYSNAWVEIDSNGTSAQPTGNAIINGAFDIWQRGTSVTVIGNGYGLDRWLSNSGSSHTISRQTTGVPFTSQYVARVTAPTGGTTNLFQLIETSNVRPLWGKTVTLSGKIRRNATLTQNMSVVISKNSTVDAGIGASGWALVNSQTFVNATMPTATGSSDWLSFSLTAVIPSDGTANSLYVGFNSGTMPSGAYYEIAEMQLEAGAVATPFKRNAPSIQGELAACQRYYQELSATQYIFLNFGTGYRTAIQLPVQMRVAPSVTVTGYSGGGTQVAAEFVSVQGFQTGANNPTSGPFFTKYTANSEL